MPPNVRAPPGKLLSAGRGRWRTLPSWLTRSTHRFSEVREYSYPVSTSACVRTLGPEGRQQQPLIGTQHGGHSAAMTATLHPAANSPPIGRGRRTITPAWIGRGRRPALSPGGLQHEELTGEQQEGVQLQPTAMAHSAVVTPSIGRGWRTTILALAAGTRQQHELLCEQHEGARPVATHGAAVSPSVGRGRRTTIPAWMTMGAGGTVHAPRELQQ